MVGTPSDSMTADLGAVAERCRQREMGQGGEQHDEGACLVDLRSAFSMRISVETSRESIPSSQRTGIKRKAGVGSAIAMVLN